MCNCFQICSSQTNRSWSSPSCTLFRRKPRKEVRDSPPSAGQEEGRTPSGSERGFSATRFVMCQRAATRHPLRRLQGWAVWQQRAGCCGTELPLPPIPHMPGAALVAGMHRCTRQFRALRNPRMRGGGWRWSGREDVDN